MHYIRIIHRQIWFIFFNGTWTIRHHYTCSDVWFLFVNDELEIRENTQREIFYRRFYAFYIQIYVENLVVVVRWNLGNSIFFGKCVGRRKRVSFITLYKLFSFCCCVGVRKKNFLIIFFIWLFVWKIFPTNRRKIHLISKFYDLMDFEIFPLKCWTLKIHRSAHEYEILFTFFSICTVNFNVNDRLHSWMENSYLQYSNLFVGWNKTSDLQCNENRRN